MNTSRVRYTKMRLDGRTTLSVAVATLILCLATSAALPVVDAPEKAETSSASNGPNVADDSLKPTKASQETAWVELVDAGDGHVQNCKISTQENLHEFIDVAEKREDVNLFEFKIQLKDYSRDPFHNVTGLYFKPWLWYTTKSQHGRTLLMLSFHYDVLSMNILTIGVKKMDILVVDTPLGCFGNLTTARQVNSIRMMLLSRVVKDKSSSREEFACNQEILNKAGNADFVYNCCYKDATGNLICSTKGDDFWINILYLAITSVKILMFLFCPKFLPNNVYSAAYVASEYVINLKKAIRMKMFISEQNDSNVRYKKRLTLEQISNWPRLRESLETLPYDELIPVKIDELRVKVQGKRIIPENDPPTGLMRTIYDNLIRCKIKNLDPFKDCCETSIFASMEPKFRHKITWHKFVQMFIKTLMLILIPIPYYIRLIIYFVFEEEEITMRRTAMERNDLTESFNLYRTNVIQYFTPSHGVFIATYVFYFLIGLVIGFTDQTFREKLKGICRCSLQDMNAVSETGVLGIIIRVLLFPFKRCGLLGFLIGPVYFVVVMPACVLVFVVYCVPTVYLSFRLPYHAKKLANQSAAVSDEEKKKRIVRLQRIGKKLSKIDKSAHLGEMTQTADNYCCPDEWGFRGCVTIKSVLLQVVTAVFCLCILYSVALVFSESIGLFVEVMAFTMMGIIVNAGSVLKYVSMVLLVFVYMNDCYSNVYENYLTFNKTIIDEIIERTTTDLRKIASMPSSEQANTAFQVRCVDEAKEKPPSLNFQKKEIRWKIGQLLLFLDCYDTPRVPLRLFQKLCQVRVHGAPGPVYINLLAATGKFMIIVVFLMFVMIVVMAFGNVYAMSSTNTTLATLAGGFVPMLLKNVLSSKGTRLSLKTVSFKGQIDEIIEEYKQYWPVVDLQVQKYDPNEEVEDDKDDDDKEGGGGKPYSNSTKKDDEGRNKDGEKGDNKRAKDGNVQNETVKKNDDVKRNGDSLSPDSGLLTPDEDENLVDLFIDLSVADTAGWSIYGSMDSMPQDSETIMPGYFDPNKITEDDDLNMSFHVASEPLNRQRSAQAPTTLQTSANNNQNVRSANESANDRSRLSQLQPQVPLVVMYAHTD